MKLAVIFLFISIAFFSIGFALFFRDTILPNMKEIIYQIGLLTKEPALYVGIGGLFFILAGLRFLFTPNNNC